MITYFPGKLLAGAVMALGLCAHANAQQYPTKPIRLIVPFAPGGTTDIVARVVATKLSENLKQPVVVENRAGAGGGIGTDFVAKAPADGYTLLLGHGGALTVNPSLYPKLPYDPIKDFTPVGMLSGTALLLVSGPASELTSLGELIKLAKAHPGKYTYSTAGAGSAAHITSELFNFQAGIQTLHVPYKGAGPATLAVGSGEVAYSFTGQAVAWPLVAGGKLRALALASTKRSLDHPEVPTVAEAGVPNFEAYDWNAILVPAGTPDAIVKKLNAEVVAVLNDAGIKSTLARQGIETRPGTPEQLTALIKSDLAKWARVIKNANIKAE